MVNFAWHVKNAGLFLCKKKPGYLAAPGSNQTSVNLLLCKDAIL